MVHRRLQHRLHVRATLLPSHHRLRRTPRPGPRPQRPTPPPLLPGPAEHPFHSGALRLLAPLRHFYLRSLLLRAAQRLQREHDSER